MDELKPQDRALNPEPRGVPLAIAGEEWMLAYGGIRRSLDELRDKIFDDREVSRQVDVRDVVTVAGNLLLLNYDLAEAEVLALLAKADRKALVKAISQALFREDRKAEPGTYSLWARSALKSCGIDPASLDPEEVPAVLAHLQRRGAIVPIEEFVGSIEYSERRRKALEDAR